MQRLLAVVLCTWMSGCLGKTKVHSYRVSRAVALPSQDELGKDLAAAVPKADAAWALGCETAISYWSRGEEIPTMLRHRLGNLEFYRHREVVVDGVSSKRATGVEFCELVAAKRGVIPPAARKKPAQEVAGDGAGVTPDDDDDDDDGDDVDGSGSSVSGADRGVVTEPVTFTYDNYDYSTGLPTNQVPFGSFEWKQVDEDHLEVTAYVGVWSPDAGVETDKSRPASHYRFTLRRAVKDGQTYFDLNSKYARDATSVDIAARATQDWLSRCGSGCPGVEREAWSDKETLPGTIDFEYQRREGFADFVVRSDFSAMRSFLKPPRFGLNTSWEKGVLLSVGLEYLVGTSDPTEGTSRFEELGRLGLEVGVGVGLWRLRRFHSGIETTEAGRVGLGMRLTGGISEGPLNNFEAKSRVVLDAYLGSRLPGFTASVGVLRTQGETQRLLTAGLKINDPALGLTGMTLAVSAILLRWAVFGIDRSGIATE